MVVNFSRSLRKLSRNLGLKKKKSSFSILLYGNLHESGVHYYLYSLLNSWLFLSFTTCIQSLDTGQDSPLFLIVISRPFLPYFLLKKKRTSSFFEAYSTSGYVTCFPSFNSVHVFRPHASLTASLLTVTPTSLWAALTFTKDAGSFTPSLPMALPFIWLQSPAPRVRLRAF